MSKAVNWLNANVDILTNLANNLAPVYRLITASAYVIGCAFAFKAIYALKIYGEMRTMQSSSASVKEPVVYLFVAAMFIYLPTGVDLVLNTTFGTSTILAYGPINSKSSTITGLFGNSAIGRPLTLIIQTIGIIAFVRGWILIARSASQGQPPGGTGKGLMHVFGGILAMNIIATVTLINNTLYGS
jgi:intracellular multiplication protein IcmC